MKSVYTDDKCSLADDVKQFPPGFKGKMVKVPIERDQVLELFPDDSKCTLYLYPYINFIDSEKKLLVPFLTKNAPIEGQWLKDIVTHTPRPKYILNIADKFMASLGLEKKNFVAIHWNFEKDYEDACNKKQGDVFCELAGNSTAAYKGTECFFHLNHKANLGCGHLIKRETYQYFSLDQTCETTQSKGKIEGNLLLGLNEDPIYCTTRTGAALES